MDRVGRNTSHQRRISTRKNRVEAMSHRFEAEPHLAGHRCADGDGAGYCRFGGAEEAIDFMTDVVGPKLVKNPPPNWLITGQAKPASDCRYLQRGRVSPMKGFQQIGNGIDQSFVSHSAET